MTLTDWARDSVGRVRRDGIQGARDSGYELWIGALRRADRFAPDGIDYYDQDWDVLVVLDGTRLDAMEEVAGEFEFVEAVDSVRSPGSATYEWLQRTFTDEHAEEIARTAYVSGNPFTNEHLDAEQFAELDEVWQYAWDDDRNTVPARPVTDRAIHHARSSDQDRLIVHYMQPHFPSVPEPLGTEHRPPGEWGGGGSWESPWKQQRKGKLDPDEVWQSYLANLRYVLEDVELLRRNVDAETLVVTADHGNARGEWGIYDHPNVPLPCLRNVPWVETSAEDSGERDPAEYAEETDDIAEERLRQLGYM